MGRYITLEDVKIRVSQKVRFTDNEDDENKMSNALANRLISEAESDVELDLSPRYASPFTTVDGGEFKLLPTNTKDLIRTLCELKAVTRILETDFGSGSVVDADKYVKKLEQRYKDVRDRLLSKKKDGGSDSQGWMFPPLIGLNLNYFNTVHDDGFFGGILTTSQGDGDYPQKQINDPQETWWNGSFDE